MADQRLRLGGWKYKKRAEEKLEREKDLLAKTKRIDQFFSKSSVDAGSIPTVATCPSP